jgi:hypothetical protein
MRKPKEDDLVTFEFHGSVDIPLGEIYRGKMPDAVTPEMIKALLLDDCRTIVCFIREWNFYDDVHLTVSLQNPRYVYGTPPLFDREQPAMFVSTEVW